MEELRELLPVGSTIYTNLKHVSRSGMARDFTVHILAHGQVRDITYMARLAGGFHATPKYDGHRIRMRGAGMDMGFHLVYSLARSLWPEGHPCIGEDARCPSNDHANEWKNPDYSPDRIHRDGGYALKHARL